MTDGASFRPLPDPFRRRVGGALSWTLERLSVARTLVRRELKTGPTVDLPWRRRLWLYRHGFTSRSGALFAPDEGSYREYLSDVQHELANDATVPWDALVNNKLAFYLLFDSYTEHLPDLYGLVDGGELRRPSRAMVEPPWTTARPTDELDGADEGSHGSTDAFGWVEAYLAEHDALVLKPVYGHGGRGVLVCRRDGCGDGYRVNGDPKTRSEFAALLDDLEEYLAWTFVEQAPYAEALFPGSANTIRAVTMWDYETDEPFLAAAIQRVGTSESAPVDNWSRGGLTAEVSADGVLGRGARWDGSTYEVRWEETHPDTGRPIEGTHVPDWPAVRERVVAMAGEYPFLPRLGWDVLLTENGGFVVLEANAHAAMLEMQIYGPLLRDPRIRRFYEYHGYA